MLCQFRPFSVCQGKRAVNTIEKLVHPGDKVWTRDASELHSAVAGVWSHLSAAGLRADSWDSKKEMFSSMPVQEEISGARQLGILRSLMASVAFEPSALVENRVQELEVAVAPPAGPMLVVHIRRTDKVRDKSQGIYSPAKHAKAKWTTSKNPLNSIVAIKALIKKTELLGGTPFRSFFLIADDPEYFRSDVLRALQSAFAEEPRPLFNPYILSQFSHDQNWKALGAFNISNTTEIDIQLMADVVFASRHGSYVVGCGRSGISQLIAQRLGARFLMDPNELALFEDDMTMMRTVWDEATIDIMNATAGRGAPR